MLDKVRKVKKICAKIQKKVLSLYYYHEKRKSMNLRYLLIMLFFALNVGVSYAQQVSQSALRLATSGVDYGTIREDGGAVTATIMAINSGVTPLYIYKAEASCGCTSVAYPLEAIAPADSVAIRVTFDPMNRPGRFEREVALLVSDSEESVVVGVQGYVEPRGRSIDEIYPFDMDGGLRLSTTSRSFGYLEHGWHSEEYIEYVNTSDSSIMVCVESVKSSGLLRVSMPTTIAAGERGAIQLGYALDEDSDLYGTIEDVLYLVVDGTRARYRLTTEVVAVDNFNDVGDISAPFADISKNIIKFGEVNCPNSIYRESLTLGNSGSVALAIRRIETTSEAVSCSLSPSGDVAPNGSAKLVISLDSSKIASSDELFSARIRIITNDPLRPMLNIRVTAIPMW